MGAGCLGALEAHHTTAQLTHPKYAQPLVAIYSSEKIASYAANAAGLRGEVTARLVKRAAADISASDQPEELRASFIQAVAPALCRAASRAAQVHAHPLHQSPELARAATAQGAALV